MYAVGHSCIANKKNLILFYDRDFDNRAKIVLI
jgi:hypothetical protein